MNRTLVAALVAAMTLVSCGQDKQTWTDPEKALLAGQADVMRVLTVSNEVDSALLRKPSVNFSHKDLRSPVYARLARKMIATVTSPEQHGVGIAGPQVGLLRRVVAVKRYDKPGEPFEVYPNIRIWDARGEKVPGPEGCLSVPGRRGEVNRWQDITISYTSPVTLSDTTENITGFTAVIFQHECDHLDGVLYIDRLR